MAEDSYCPPPNLAHRTLRDFPPFTLHTGVFHLKSSNSSLSVVYALSNTYYRRLSTLDRSAFDRGSFARNSSHHTAVIVRGNFSRWFVENDRSAADWTRLRIRSHRSVIERARIRDFSTGALNNVTVLGRESALARDRFPLDRPSCSDRLESEPLTRRFPRNAAKRNGVILGTIRSVGNRPTIVRNEISNRLKMRSRRQGQRERTEDRVAHRGSSGRFPAEPIYTPSNLDFDQEYTPIPTRSNP